MPIITEPLTESDFVLLQSYSDSPAGDTAAPALLSLWPTPSAPETDTSGLEARSDARTARLGFSLQQEKHFMTLDPSVHLVKAIDSDNGEIVAVARWHYYAQGFDPDAHAWMEVDCRTGPVKLQDLTGEQLVKDGLKFPVAAWVALFKQVCEGRQVIYGPGRGPSVGPCWVLTTLVTRSGHRKRGAGGKLVQWGCDRADADKCRAYLEAGPMGKPLYEKFGFKDLAICDVELISHGGLRNFALHCMEREPKTT